MNVTDRSGPLFPLPLVPFERYMLLDDRPDYPMTGLVGMDFLGEFDRPAFEAALDEALARHPLFWALIERSRRGPRWVAAPEQAPPLDWAALEVPMDCPRGEAIDLAREVGFRLWVRQGDSRAKLVFLLHHSASDAIGSVQFLGDLLAGYAVRRGGLGPEALAPVEPQRLHKRGLFEEPPPEPVSQWKATRFMVAEAVKWFARRPAPLAAPDADRGAAAEDYQFPGMHVHTFDEARTRALRDAAARDGATVNDLLLRDLFLAIRAWNRECGHGKERGYLRIVMPTNLREKLDRRMPSANKMSYAFLTRRPRECDEPAALLEGLRKETEAIKYWRMGQAFVAGMGAFMQIPGATRLVASRHWCMATAVLSNIGDPAWHFWTEFPRRDGLLAMGDVRLERIVASPPLRPKTRTCVVATRYAGRLTLTVRCARQLFRPADSRRFLALYVKRLDETLAAPGPK